MDGRTAPLSDSLRVVARDGGGEEDIRILAWLSRRITTQCIAWEAAEEESLFQQPRDYI